MRRVWWGRHSAIEDRLRSNRPETPPELLEHIADRISAAAPPPRSRIVSRYAVALAVVVVLVAALASLGALSSAGSSARRTASATADAATRVVSPAQSPAKTSSTSPATVTTSAAGGAATPSDQTSVLLADSSAATRAKSKSAASQPTPSITTATGVELPSVRFLATIGTYAANQWICHYIGGPPQAPGQWEVIQLTSMAVYLAHAGHAEDHGPYATEPTQIFCAENRDNA
jgi:hypothetical protein